MSSLTIFAQRDDSPCETNPEIPTPEGTEPTLCEKFGTFAADITLGGARYKSTSTLIAVLGASNTKTLGLSYIYIESDFIQGKRTKSSIFVSIWKIV